jgi:glycosyltransferase involved in cell wall biosynthesis
MRITFVLPPVDLSGGIRVVAIYATWLREHGHDVTLVSPPHREPELRRKVASLLKGKGWPVAKAIKSHLDGANLDHRLLDTFRPVTEADVPDADVVIATWWETAEWVNALSPAKGAKVHFVQGHEVFDYLPLARCQAAYRMPLHKIVISRWLADVMRNEYGDANVDLVQNAIDHQQFFAPVRGRQDRPTVGFLYHSAPFKGADTVLQVIERLRSMFGDVRIISFGSHLPNPGLSLDPDIEFHLSPPQDRIRDLYAQCDVWLTASRSEGFNLPAMEAMACRTPVVSTRVGWPEEAIVTSQNGILADVDDVAGLTEGAAWVIGLTDAEWRRVSENAFQTVATSSWDASAKMFEAALVGAVARA